MSNEIQTSFSHGASLYALIWNNRQGTIANVSTGVFETYATANYGTYTASLTELGTASHHYQGNFPAVITAPGTYGIECRQQIGGSPAETDPTVGESNIDWGGAVYLSLADFAVSGYPTQVRLQRGVAVSGFPLYLKSNSDHVTPFTSGVCSGQISRNGGAFVALQSGNFFEVGLGFYGVNLTSGDVNADVIRLNFSANGISGGASDPLPLGFVMQRTSGN